MKCEKDKKDKRQIEREREKYTNRCFENYQIRTRKIKRKRNKNKNKNINKNRKMGKREIDMTETEMF
jgi:hypothetical protein